MPEYCFSRRYSGIFSLFQNFFRNIAKIKIVTRIEMSEKRDTSLGIPFDWYTTSPTWKLRYNKRTFGVTKTEYGFSDDYQLEDIFEWSVDYLKTVNILTDCIHLSLLLIYIHLMKNILILLKEHYLI